jgi:hypothetical protein
MGTWQDLRKFISLDFRNMLMLMEAFFELGLARIMVAVPFARVAPLLGTPMKETSGQDTMKHEVVLHEVQRAIRIASVRTWWQSKCLVKAIAGMRMLERRGVESTLYLGTAKDEAGRMIAHAWLRNGSFYICGEEGMEDFTIVGMFAKTVKS